MIALALLLAAAPLTARQVVDLVVEGDAWGLADAQVVTHGIMTDKHGSTSELRFTSSARRYDPPLSRTLVRFSAPADLAGAGFLQTQKRDGDDDRWLFLPELKRSRRISGSLRSSSFMGTEYSFADIDKRDLRDGEASLAADETLAGKYPCWHAIVKTTRADSEYSRIELWVRKDNQLPVLLRMYDKAGELLKTLTAAEVRRIQGRWYITRSLMENVREQHRTEWILEQVVPGGAGSDDDYSVRNLEKM
ncbi:MAG: outer membrane lipoprotein-sorting protein [Myxococcales bacterium]